MSKPLYLVEVIAQGLGANGENVDSAVPAVHPVCDSTHQHPGKFTEAVRASNRREATILVKRKYPGYLVLGKVMRVPQSP
jgi:hypothetical protein